MQKKKRLWKERQTSSCHHKLSGSSLVMWFKMWFEEYTENFVDVEEITFSLLISWILCSSSILLLGQNKKFSENLSHHLLDLDRKIYKAYMHSNWIYQSRAEHSEDTTPRNSHSSCPCFCHTSGRGWRQTWRRQPPCRGYLGRHSPCPPHFGCRIYGTGCIPSSTAALSGRTRWALQLVPPPPPPPMWDTPWAEAAPCMKIVNTVLYIFLSLSFYLKA